MKKKSSITSKLRNAFIAGIVVLVPIGFTLYLTLFLIKISSKLIPNEINPNNYLPFSIPGLEILLSVIFITIVGGISLSFFGKKILNLINDLFKRIPILRTIYSAIGQMTESFTSKSDNKKSVVLIEYPKKGSWAVGFATKENKGEISKKTNKDLINVFVPTTPNPTSGFLLMFPKDEVIYLDMTFEEASKFIVSAGTSDPADN
ncbi:DUF502 domain-containing protein [Candidatus Pelagibacter communis]|uniref:DUF502 domain-containing protein n=1 Tax=Pelagibacter ubique TaxID=198252 RepID=UPI00094C5B9A|nr:DUF502 domain-containing protein [Candidatus Pelagibacter ubique]